MDNSGCRRRFEVQNSWHVPFVRNIPPLHTEWLSFAFRPHQLPYPAPPPTLKGWIFPHPNWLTCFPVSQVVGCRCTLLAGNSFVSLAGSGEQKNLCQQSPKMLKTASESFIHALVLFFGLFLKISCCVPLCLSSIQFTCVFPGFPGPCSGVLRVLEKYRSQPSITAAYYKCLLTWGLMLRTRERERDEGPSRRGP